MARQKLSEYRTKTLLYSQFGTQYRGVQITPHAPLNMDDLDVTTQWVVKVDQGVKKRGKQGLVKVNVDSKEIPDIINKWASRGYEYFITEPMVVHDEKDEHYLAIQRTGDGISLTYNQHGGIDIEEHSGSNVAYSLSEEYFDEIARTIGLPTTFLYQLILFFNRHHFSFLEINPYLVLTGEFVALDAAAYVDGAAHLLAAGSWTEEDFRSYGARKQTDEEIFIKQLANSSQASFKYEIINPDGAVFMLLSGGGASIVLADEVFSQGAGDMLANYGEYSGNPNSEETFLYTSAVLRSLLASAARDKKLILAGGVANFTDIRATFNGIIRALNDHADKLLEQNVKVFVRRGGPYEAEALETMRIFLEAKGLFGSVSGHDTLITSVVSEALAGETV